MDTLPQLTDDEFEQIEEAIARTAKGRAFLRRLHRRAMGAASEEIRTMLVEFRQSWKGQVETVEQARHVGVLRRELMEMAASIEQARREVAALRPPDGASNKIVSATNELDAIVISTERASFEILNAAERLMDLNARLRADGASEDICSALESEVTNIFTACSFQDLTGQRTSKVVNALRYIEQRINAMIGIWGEEGMRHLAVAEEPVDHRPDAHLLNGPQLEGHGISQADVDSMFDTRPPAPPPVPVNAPQSQADIDSLFDTAPTPPPPPKATQSQADIDSLFDGPAPMPPSPPPPPPAPKPAAKPPTPKSAKAAPAKPPPPPPPPAPAADPGGPPAPLDQAAIDALFG